MTKTLRACLVPLLAAGAVACGSSKAASRDDGATAPVRKPVAASVKPRPGWVEDALNRPPMECPRDTHMVGVGASDESAEKAQEAARAALARQVSSSIREVINRRTTSAGGTGQAATAQFFNSVAATQCTEFRHAELMVSAGSWTDGSTFHQAVCLDRARASAAVQQDATVPLATFRRTAQDALAAAQKKDRSAFMAAHAQAMMSATQVMPLAFQLDLLSPGSESAALFWKDLDTLVSEAAGLLASMRFAVDVEGNVPAEEKDRIAASMVSGVSTTGVPAVRSSQCGDAAYLARLKLTPSCAYRSLGHTCRVAAVLEMSECGVQRAPSTVEFPGAAKLSGISPRDEQGALQKAFKALDSEAVAAWLGEVARKQVPAQQKPEASRSGCL